MIQRFSTTASGEPGSGTLICQCYDDKTKFSRIHAQYPLKFIPTRGHAERLAVVYMISYGGGIVSGDRFNISIDILPKAILLLLTQGNTKVFKDRIHQRQWMTLLAQRTQPSLPFQPTLPSTPTPTPSKITRATPEQTSIQSIRAKVSAGGILLIIPDPVTSFAESSFTSRQELQLEDDTSQLVLLDWFTSGRHTRGENWAFHYYASRIDIRVKGRLVIKDHMVLEDDNTQQKEETSYAAKLRPYTCFATLIIIANKSSSLSSDQSSLYQSIKRIIHQAEEMRMLPHAMKEQRDLLWSVSPLLDQRGVLVRIAGMTTEMVRDFVKLECLGQGLKDIVGDGMFGKILM
ncbi:urease accessory protein UreD [Halteromyces radiatus]|uniref:urease accessory protein UreD n=1 Tax=Halteromyces radiatus TaxID=101107 RepID=UPI002220687B|nr:urease accessory protein UreD [Halteromyces radiatus]KAI8097146.1 urease accessory protein UreD [Halteromyces radiatus]